LRVCVCECVGVMGKGRRNNNHFYNNASVFDRTPSFSNVGECQQKGMGGGGSEKLAIVIIFIVIVIVISHTRI